MHCNYTSNNMFSFFNKPKEPIKLWFTTDIHAHILPGIDDGSPDVDTSLSLLEAMRDYGLKKVIASPHVTENTFENTPDTIESAYNTLQHAMQQSRLNGIGLAYHAENRIDSLFVRNMNEGKLLTLPQNYLLIENSFVQEPWNLDQLIYDLQVKSYLPIMAHPERFQYYSMERLKDLHRKADFQINLLSLTGYYGKKIRKRAEDMIEARLVDFIGTDTHNMAHVNAVREYLCSKNAIKDRDMLASRIKNHIFD